MEQAISTGLKDASAILKTGSCQLCGVLVVTNGTNAATVVLYDALSATGTELFSGIVAGTTGFQGFFPVHPIKAKTGIYAAISGTGAKCIVYYR